MTLRGNDDRYGLLARTLHWTVVVLFIALVAGGQYIDSLGYDDPQKPLITSIHRTIGLAMFCCMLARLVWAFCDRRPPPLSSLKTWERFLSKAVHYGFYLLLLAIPVVGYLYSGASVDQVRFAGFSLPSLVSFSRDEAEMLIETHENLSKATALLVALHVAGSLKHHYLDKVRIFGRMW